MASDKVWQEFYCMECVGFFRVKLNMALNIGVEIVCPNCGHKHHRYIQNGVIFESGRESNRPVEEICPPKSAYSKEPLTDRMSKSYSRRDGVKIEKQSDLNMGSQIANNMIKERWFEIYGGNIS